ncbi:MAG TPA: DNA polymerase, partial [Candidatus Brocadiia bacterium]|nr:DNA polymerase [Candidatus Brocadiia bacterium]
QLGEVLFDTLGLPSSRRGKTGRSTDSEVLQQLMPLHPVPGLVLEYRQAVKLKNTYVDALPEMVSSMTGKLHTSFSQTATATGRLSSSDPNLQNIPIRTEMGSEIRRAFVPSEPGWVFVSADYSQIELRILAHLSKDPDLCEAFRKDEDIHRFVAAQVFGVAPGDVSESQRRAAKAVNFGIIYGLTAYGLSRDIGVSVKEADTFINSYFERWPGVKRFIDETVASAREKKQVETLKGRRRPMPDIDASDASRRSFAERAAVNTVVQGSAADMMKLAMAAIQRRMDADGLRARMLLQIHDELLFEAPPKEKAALEALAVEEMAKAMPLDVPVKVNVASGPNWAEAK